MTSICMCDLPIKLKQEPLVDAIFEFRFDANLQFSSVAPGYLYSELPNVRRTNDLPQKEIAKAIRDRDAHLFYAPIVQVEWGEYFINIGDRVVSIGCRLPYPGWSEFRSSILLVVEKLSKLSLIENVHRHSMKYTNIIEAGSIEEQINSIEFTLSVGPHALANEPFKVMINVNDEHISHIINLASSANAVINGASRHGVVVDIDSLVDQNSASYMDWVDSLESNLDALRQSNKKEFFNCLKKDTVTAMEPVYE